MLLFNCRDKIIIIIYGPGCHLLRQRLCLLSSFAALQVALTRNNWSLYCVFLPNVVSGFLIHSSFSCEHTRLGFLMRKQMILINRVTSVQQLFAVTRPVCTMSTHALRILGGVVDCTRRSHCHRRGYRWGHRTHGMKHRRAKTWVGKKRFSIHYYSVWLCAS